MNEEKWYKNYKDYDISKEYMKVVYNKMEYKTVEERVDDLEAKLDRIIKFFNKFFDTNLGDE